MDLLKKIWKGWMRVGMFIGNIVSSIFLTIFYFTIFALFAIPYRIVHAWSDVKKSSFFKEPNHRWDSRADFEKEF